MKKLDQMTTDEHKHLGIDLFNHTWELMDRVERSAEEDMELLNMAHASYYHWIASKPPVVNLARGEWLISRVYCVLRRPEPALFHANRSLEYCVKNGIADFDLAFGYEAVARALSLTNDPAFAATLAQAHQAAADVKDPEDRQIVMRDLETIVCQ